MTDLRWRPTPGPEGFQQPKVKTTWAHEIPWRPIAVTAGNPKDQGMVRRLIHPEVNGSTDVEFFFGIYRMEPGEYHPRHHHPNGAELYYVVSGTADFWVDDKWVEGAPGLSLYFSRNTSHGIRVTGDEPLELLYWFSPPDLDRVGINWEE